MGTYFYSAFLYLLYGVAISFLRWIPALERRLKAGGKPRRGALAVIGVTGFLLPLALITTRTVMDSYAWGLTPESGVDASAVQAARPALILELAVHELAPRSLYNGCFNGNESVCQMAKMIGGTSPTDYWINLGFFVFSGLVAAGLAAWLTRPAPASDQPEKIT
jgi:hypothetical protein